MDYSRIARGMREQIEKFLGVVCRAEGKVAHRFVAEMVYGIQASQSVMLSEIARSLQESISIKKTHERLVRQLGREGLGERLQQELLRYASGRVVEDTLLVLDVSDISKRYAHKMEYLTTVRDGSAGELKSGYWTMNVIATDEEGEMLMPLYQKLYSAEAPVFESENIEILKAMCAVSEHTCKRGIWVVDRGGDREKLIKPMLEMELRFIIRLQGGRHLHCGNRTACALELAESCQCPYTETIVKSKGEEQKIYHISYGYMRVKLPGRQEQLWMLVVKGFGKTPLMLLTTEPLRRSRKLLRRLAHRYYRRWSIEETIRYLKQSYGLENVRVLRYRSLQNLFVLALLASHFACAVLALKAKLKIMTRRTLLLAKRIFGIPKFMYYAIADGIKTVFSRHPCPPRPPSTQQNPQLTLFNT